MKMFRLRTRRTAFRLLVIPAAIGCLLLGLLVFGVPSPLPDAVTWSVSPALLDKNGDLFHARLSANEEFCLPIPLSRMGKWLPAVAMDVEDRRFYSHFGIDVFALARAAVQNLRSGSVVSGASTITSQVIRLTYPRERSLKNKALEFAQAIKLEWSLPKEKILELYLNRAPFGGPVRGVEAAARSYFGKRAEELSLAESAMLIGMLRGPSLYRPDRNPEMILERRNSILERLQDRDLAPAGDVAMAVLEKLPERRGAIPQRFRHYADFALRGLPAGYWHQGSSPVKTTLDPFLQAMLEQGIDDALTSFPANVTGAGGIMDNATGALLAYVGNARFDLGAQTQWVDCGNAPRSPGSVLKPFVYLLAMEQGNIVPATLVADTPLSFAGMAPRNYDRQYRGPVTVEFALANSLNAPAVRVLRRAGNEPVIQFLRTLGFSLLTKSGSHYGDSLALGGCEVTLLQTMQAFASLATLGVYRPLTALDASSNPGRLGEQRLFSAPAAFLVAESLRDTGRMSPVLREAFREQGRMVAFKTGTSYGLRDAWTAAYTPKHTVTVWLGDPQGLPHPALSGLPVAAPLALRILRDIPYNKKDAAWYSPPPGLERFTACALSGAPATPFCPSRKQAWLIRDVSRTIPCPMHTVRDGILQTVLPPELESYANAPDTSVARKERIDITLPQPGMRFFLTPHAEQQQIALTCEGAQGKVYWFINQEFFGAQEKGEALLWPLKPGKHRLSLVDEHGNTAFTTFSVIDVLAKEPRPLELHSF
ncbi:Penicillin-binding protein 1C [uncultured delta proteobacterium]|uniref:peptidoglycan glycosyltransferase n=1 Tax=uncultured delta proteobacterium TaxID=34034 RepID=A0A212J3M6_9DELT|nr:Penicillin-binding protein 1C [uncultured delta proteobacterium]